MKRSRANVAEKNPDPDPESLIKRSTSKKEKRQVASATISKAPTSFLVDFENDLINVSTRDSLDNNFTRILTDTPIELINGDSDFENQRTRDAFNPREFQRSIESFLDKKFSQMENRRQRDNFLKRNKIKNQT